MRHWIQRLSGVAFSFAGRSSRDHARRPELNIDEIPRYPPYERGLPACDADQILRRQPELLANIRQLFSFSDDEYSAIISPVIVAFAEHVHLLPASERHHHRGAGGAFRHGLEVAFAAGRASGAHVFAPAGTPLERIRVEVRWQVATFFAGLLHDAGKPLTDVDVTNESGSSRWDPCSKTLVEWARANDTDRYFLRWRNNRGKSHEQFAAIIGTKILSPDVIGWMNDGDNLIYRALMTHLSGASGNEILDQIVKKADSDSVQRDLTTSGGIVDAGYGVPVERYIMDAMRRLLSDGTWTCNQPGARVWIVSDGNSDGVFIVWRAATKDIISVLDEDGVKGVPRNHDSLADILIERDLALSNSGFGTVYRYWPVLPEILCHNERATPLMMLRLKAPRALFEECPPPVEATIGPASSPRRQRDEADIADAPPAAPKRKGEGGEMPFAVVAVAPSPSPPPPLPVTGIIVTRPNEVHEGGGMTVLQPAPLSSDPPVEIVGGREPREVETGAGIEAAQATIEEESAPAPLPESTLAGRLLAMMARSIAEGRAVWGEQLALLDGALLVKVPDGLKPYVRFERGVEEPDLTILDLANVIDREGWVTRSPSYSTTLMSVVAGVRGIIIRADVAESVIFAAGDGQAPDGGPSGDPPSVATLEKTPSVAERTVAWARREPRPTGIGEENGKLIISGGQLRAIASKEKISISDLIGALTTNASVTMRGGNCLVDKRDNQIG